MNKIMNLKNGTTFSGTCMENGHEVSYTLVWNPMSDEQWERRLRYQFKKRNCSVHKSRSTGLYKLIDDYRNLTDPYYNPDYDAWCDLTLPELQYILERIVDAEN